MNKIPLVITSARSHAQTCIHPCVLTSYTGLQGPGHGKVRSEGVHSLGSAARAGRKAARGWKLRPGQSLGRSSPFALVLLEFSYLLTQIIANVNTYFNDLTEIGGACLTCCASSLLMGAQQDHSCEPGLRSLRSDAEAAGSPRSLGLPGEDSAVPSSIPGLPCAEQLHDPQALAVSGRPTWSGGHMDFHSFGNGKQGWIKVMFFEAEDNWINFG